jgi:hypothetical protein
MGGFMSGLFSIAVVLIYLGLIAFLFMMLYRFVRAVERIAEKFETGIPIKKQDTV